MAGHRLYVTIPERDFRLIQHWAMIGAECPGMWARRVVLTELYKLLRVESELKRYDEQLAAEERRRFIEDGR